MDVGAERSSPSSAGGSSTSGAIDRTRNTGTIKGDTKAIMKSMRREMKVSRSKSALVIAVADAFKDAGPSTGETKPVAHPSPLTAPPLTFPITKDRVSDLSHQVLAAASTSRQVCSRP